jgi:hypothetical protein
MYRIGYIDEDNGWKNTFRQSLKDDFEIILFDIKDDSTVESLVAEIFDAKVDMIVLDFRLDETGLVEFNADALVDKILETNLYFPLIVLTSHEIDALEHLSNANIVNGKDMLEGDSPKVDILKHKINKLVIDYNTRITDSTTELKALEAKKEDSGLQPAEEDRYVELNNFFDKLSDAKGHISRTFYSQDTNKRLDILIKKTEELINKLPKN